MANVKTTVAQERAFSQWKQELSKMGWNGGKRTKFDEKKKVHPWLSYSAYSHVLADDERLAVKGKKDLVFKNVKKIETDMKEEKDAAEEVVNKRLIQNKKFAKTSKRIKKVVKKVEKKVKRKKRK